MTREKRHLLILFATAFALRAGLAILHPSTAHPDEIYQYQEPAHRLLTGLGITTWEWTQHVRSWLIPGLILPIMAAVRIFTHSPQIYAAVISCVMAAASLPVVWVAYQWASEEGGEDGALIAGSLAAVSFQLVYYSPHLLMDTLATDLLLPALYACRAYRRQTCGLLWGPALLGVIVYLRPQLAPALLLPAGATLWAAHQRRQIIACIAWGLTPLFALGVFDWITLGLPFQSVWLYAYVNLFQVQTEFGVLPWYWYLGNNLLIWSSALVPIGIFSALTAKKFRVELITALLIFAVMSLIAHKEQRFVLPAQAILLVLTGAGIAKFRAARNGFFARPPFIIGVTALVSLFLATTSFRPTINSNHTELTVLNRIMADPQACGIYLLPRAAIIEGAAGYTGLRDNIQLRSDWFTPPQTNIAQANYLVTRLKPAETQPIPAGYNLQSCATDADHKSVCTYHRAGNCG